MRLTILLIFITVMGCAGEPQDTTPKSPAPSNNSLDAVQGESGLRQLNCRCSELITGQWKNKYPSYQNVATAKQAICTYVNGADRLRISAAAVGKIDNKTWHDNVGQEFKANVTSSVQPFGEGHYTIWQGEANVGGELRVLILTDPSSSRIIRMDEYTKQLGLLNLNFYSSVRENQKAACSSR